MGARGKARRHRLGLTVKQMAETLGITRQRMDQLETDGAESLSVIRRWADALGLDPQDLAFGTPALDEDAGLTPTPKKKRARRA